MVIEVEIRAFIDENKYNELLEYFSKEGVKKFEDEQETYYFDCEEDVRIQKCKDYSKIWMKKGKMHDNSREEVEVKLSKEDFPKLESIFKSLGHEVEIKWFRKRSEFDWRNIRVCLDYTRGYGYILELEKMSNEELKESDLKFIKEKLKELGVEETPKEVFENRYKYYKENWSSLV